MVAVSKTKPAVDIMELYNHGHRHFGENYVQELIEKAQTLPTDINWHFIGHLQSGKAKDLIKGVPNLFVIETVDSLKLAQKLNSSLETAQREQQRIFIQVHTSNEDTKSGVLASEVGNLVAAILESCPLLHIGGLMTIGAPGDYSCFAALVECRANVCSRFGWDIENLELSMGTCSVCMHIICINVYMFIDITLTDSLIE